MTLYTKTDPLVVLEGRAKKQPSKLGENAQSPVEKIKKNDKAINGKYDLISTSQKITSQINNQSFSHPRRST